MKKIIFFISLFSFIFLGNNLLFSFESKETVEGRNVKVTLEDNMIITKTKIFYISNGKLKARCNGAMTIEERSIYSNSFNINLTIDTAILMVKIYTKDKELYFSFDDRRLDASKSYHVLYYPRGLFYHNALPEGYKHVLNHEEFCYKII